MSDELPDLPPASLELRQTRLRLEEGELVRRNEGGGIVMRIPLDDLESAAFVREFNTLSFVVLALAAGVALIGAFVSEYNVVTVVLYVLAMFLAGFGVVAMRGDVIVVKTRGETIRVSCPDPTDEVVGFAASLRSHCGGR